MNNNNNYTIDSMTDDELKKFWGDLLEDDVAPHIPTSLDDIVITEEDIHYFDYLIKDLQENYKNKRPDRVFKRRRHKMFYEEIYISKKMGMELLDMLMESHERICIRNGWR